MGGPFCARAGVPVQTSAVAVATAMRRAAGVVRRGLIGLSVPVMSAWLRTIFPRNLVVRRRTVNAIAVRADCGTFSTQIVRANAATAGRGSARGSKGLKTMLDAARRLIAPSARSDVPAFMVMDVMAAAARIEAAGGRVIHMEVGQPAAAAPATAIAAARAALASGRLRYTETLGLPTLRARIARHYHDTYGVAVDPARVVVTTGSSGGFILAFLALFEPGDRVAVALPGYPPYRHILSALGCEPVAIETTQATRWAITPEMLMTAHRKAPLKGVLVASPANPTGTMMTGQAL